MELKIERPDVPHHFMVLRSIDRRVICRLPEGNIIAETKSALRLMEAGKTLYDPVIYFPKADLNEKMIKQKKSTFCPLKGEASYYTLDNLVDAEIGFAWSYEDPLPFSRQIKGLVAFYSEHVILEEHPN